MEKQPASRVQQTILWLAILLVLGLIIYGVVRTIIEEAKPRQMVSIGKVVFRAEIAETELAREKGLSGRTSMGPNDAMLFKFDSDKEWGIWMKGMKMPLDIIWINKNKEVVHVEHNVQPDAEPYVTYRPPSPARYVLEIPAGKAKDGSVSVGSTVRFSDSDEEVL